jgi:hypothetical protein
LTVILLGRDHPPFPVGSLCPVIPVCHWLLCSFQGPRRGQTRRRQPRTKSSEPPGHGPVSQNSTACDGFAHEPELARLPLSGPVDMSSGRSRSRRASRGRSPGDDPTAIGALQRRAP